MAPVIEQFEKQNPDIKVEFSNAPPVAEYIQALQTRCCRYGARRVRHRRGEQDQPDRRQAGGRPAGEPFMANVAEFNQTTYPVEDGAVYGLSIASWGAGILYNKDLLAKAGRRRSSDHLGRVPGLVPRS